MVHSAMVYISTSHLAITKSYFRQEVVQVICNGEVVEVVQELTS